MADEDDDKLAGLNAYLGSDIEGVKGWCIPQLWQSVWPIARTLGNGPVAEIGVFEGRFFIGLCKTFGTAGKNRAVAIDVFDQQQFNLDGAGVGKAEVLRSNLDRHGIGADHVEFMARDSLSLTSRDAAELIAKIGRVAFFSIDGCHEVVHTINDVDFAMSVTRHDGLIALDDYTNQNWPGVQEAVARMYLLGTPNFVPLVVTCNKLLLCSYSFHATYLETIATYLESHFPDTRVKRVRRFGFDSLTVQPGLSRWLDLV